MSVSIALPVVKACPACGSEKTSIVPRKGLELLAAAVTHLRKYECRECGRAFRAGDRRRKSRVAGTALPVRRA